MNINDVISHYDKLIEENNDPARDPEPMRLYMDKWDGDEFIKELRLDSNKSILEIGVGTGRLVLSIDINQSNFIDMRTRKIDIYPDTAENIEACLNTAGFFITRQFDTEYAHIFVAEKRI